MSTLPRDSAAPANRGAGETLGGDSHPYPTTSEAAGGCTITARPPNIKAIPAGLTERHQWVVWKLEAVLNSRTGEQRPTKVPYRPTPGGGKAASNDPNTWGSFNSACARFSDDGFGGVGLMLLPDNGLVGADFDACIDPETSEIAASVLADVRRLDSYTEVSPSGRGLRVFVRGAMPNGRGRNWRALKTEAYDRARFLTVTGLHLAGTPTTIEDRADELLRLIEEWDERNRQAKAAAKDGRTRLRAVTNDEVLTAARDAKNGAKFGALFDAGDWRGEGYPSQSEADLALCDLLAFWTNGDETSIDRLFRRSALYREKWERADYRSETIAKAVQLVRQPRSSRQQLRAVERAAAKATRRRAGFTTEELAEIIAERYGGRFAQDAGRRLYIYREGRFCPRGDEAVRRMVKAIYLDANAGAAWRVEHAEATAEFLRVDAPELWERPPLDTLNVRNGLLDVATGELRLHSSDWLSPVQLPVIFDPDAACPAWDSFVTATFPGDGRELAWELPAWLMLPHTGIQKAILLEGSGRNGKSRYLMALIAFLGGGNISNLSLQRLEGDRFAAARLLGKLANICPDLPSTHLENTSSFKAITGGDPVTGEYKFKDTFDFVPFARLVFSANHLPQAADGSEAFFRRWLVVPFHARFEGDDEIDAGTLDARLAAPAELSGVLNRALTMLPRLRERGLTESASMQEAKREFRRRTDPLAVWLEAMTVELPDAFVSKEGLLSDYNRDCGRNGRPIMTQNGFGRALKEARPGVRDGQRTIGGKVTWVYLGIGLRASASPVESHGPPGLVVLPPASVPSHSRDSRDSRESALYTRKEFSTVTDDREAGEEGEQGAAERGESERTQVKKIPVNPVNFVDVGEFVYCAVGGCFSAGVARAEVESSPWCAAHADRAALLTAALAAQWPRVEVKPAHTVVGERNWTTFARAASDADIATAIAKLGEGAA